MDKKSRINSFLLKLAIILIIILVVLAVFRAKCTLEKVYVTGTTYYDETELYKLTTNSPLDYYAPFYCLNIKKNKGHGIPFIEKIDARMVSLSEVELTVYNKKITGCIEAMGGLFYFDRDGLVVECSDRMIEGIPLVEGIDFDNIVVGKKLSVQKEKVFDTILNLVLLIESQEMNIDKITFQRSGSVVLDIGQTTVLAGERTSYDIVINALPNIIGVLDDKNVTLDMENYSETNTKVIGKPKK